MNVDEGMNLLKDPKVWNVELRPRAGAFPQRSRPSAWQLASVGFAAIAAVAVITTSALVLGGLVPKPQVAAPDPTRTSDSSTPPPIERTGLTGPIGIFDGDCTQFISNDDMSAIAGIPLAASVEPDYDGDGIRDPDSTLYRQLGVLSCAWEGDGGYIYLTVLRNDIAPGGSTETCGSYGSGEASLNTDLCVIDVVAHGLRMSGSVIWPSHAESTAVADRLIEHFESTDPDPTAATGITTSNDAWPQPKACAARSPLEVGTESITLEREILGSDGGKLPVEEQLADRYSQWGCIGDVTGTDGGTDRFSFDAVPDGAWQFDLALDQLDSDETTYESVMVPGFDQAVLDDSDNSATYYLLSGSNYLRVTVYGNADAETLIAAILAAVQSPS